MVPATSETMACRRERIRLNSDDLPTLGRPIMATMGAESTMGSRSAGSAKGSTGSPIDSSSASLTSASTSSSTIPPYISAAASSTRSSSGSPKDVVGFIHRVAERCVGNCIVDRLVVGFCRWVGGGHIIPRCRGDSTVAGFDCEPAARFRRARTPAPLSERAGGYALVDRQRIADAPAYRGAPPLRSGRAYRA